MRKLLYTSLSLLAMSVAANATSYTVSDTAPVGFELYDLDPYIGQQDFTIAGTGLSFVGQGFVYAAGDNVPGVRVGSDVNSFIAVQPGGGQTLWGLNGSLVVELYTRDDYNVLAAGSTVLTGSAFTTIPSSTIFVTFTGDFNEATMTTLGYPATEFSIGHIESSTATPELSTWAMFGVGMTVMALGGYRSRKNRLVSLA